MRLSARAVMVAVLCAVAAAYPSGKEPSPPAAEPSAGVGLRLRCAGAALESLAPQPHAIQPQFVEVSHCLSPAHDFKSSFQKLGVDVTHLRMLALDDVGPLKDEQFGGLEGARVRVSRRGPREGHGETAGAVALTVEYAEGPKNLSKAVLLRVDCSPAATLSQSPRAAPDGRTLTAHAVEINHCAPGENDTLSTDLSAIAATAHVTSLSARWPAHALRASYFSDTPLHELSVTGVKINANPLPFAMDAPLPPSLTTLKASAVALPPFSPSHLHNVSLSHGESAGEWGECGSLEELRLHDWKVPEVKDWLSQCTNLSTLTLTAVDSGSAVRAVRGAPGLAKLIVRSCELRIVPADMLAAATKLEYVDLEDNALRTIDSAAFAHQPSLRSLSLSRNQLSSSDSGTLRTALAAAKQLELLDLSWNVLLDFCETTDPSEAAWASALPSARRLLLRGTATSRLCFQQWTALEHLDLGGSRVHEIELSELPGGGARSVSVDLRMAPVVRVLCGGKCEDLALMGPNITVLGDIAVDCDCAHAAVRSALTAHARINIPIHCKGLDGEGEGVKLLKADKERLDCEKYECGGCVCRKQHTNETVSADCQQQGLATLPAAVLAQPKLTRLAANGNRIETLQGVALPEGLLEIDLTDNLLSSVPESLFTSSRRLRLSGSRPHCVCEHIDDIKLLNKYKEQIIDYKEIRCANSEQALHEVDLEKLCAHAAEASASATSAPAATVAAKAN